MSLISREFLPVRPTEVGKIKIGGRGRARETAGGGTSYIPERFDHFVVTTMERQGKDGPFVADGAVHAVVGEKPRELLGTLMYPEVAQNLHTEMCIYKGRRKMRSCDGVQYSERKGGTGPCQRAADGTGCACKPYARLHLQLDAAPHMGGYYVYRTHGWASTNNLQTTLEEIRREFGTLYRAPVKLFMQLTEDTYSEGEQERTGKSWKVGIVLNIPVQQARAYLEQQARAALKTREVLMLEAGAVVADLDVEDVVTEGELADEFAPPDGVRASVGTQSRLDEALQKVREVSGDSSESSEPPVVEAEYEVEEAESAVEATAAAPAPAVEKKKPPRKKSSTKPTAPPTGPVSDVAKALLEAALQGGALTEPQIANCRESIGSGDEKRIAFTADFLRERMKKLGVPIAQGLE